MLRTLCASQCCISDASGHCVLYNVATDEKFKCFTTLCASHCNYLAIVFDVLCMSCEHMCMGFSASVAIPVLNLRGFCSWRRKRSGRRR